MPSSRGGVLARSHAFPRPRDWKVDFRKDRVAAEKNRVSQKMIWNFANVAIILGGYFVQPRTVDIVVQHESRLGRA